MKISLMIKSISFIHHIIRIPRILPAMLLFLGIASFPVEAASPPKELSKIISHFMDMDSTSLEIHQVIDWRFAGNDDSIRIRMDINAGRNFHVMLPAFGMEIYVTQNEMITINHNRQQVLYENATPDALLKQLFVGGDLNDARFRREQDKGDGTRQLDFRFIGDFSDWESLSVIVDEQDSLKKMILVDYDGNKYLISLKYLAEFERFVVPDIDVDYLHYQRADLRGQ